MEFYEKELSYENRETDAVIKEFLSKIGAGIINKDEFNIGTERWMIDYHPFDHSDDIIVEESLAKKYDKFLLVKTGSNKLRIVGWTDQKTLISVPARDIYRTGKKHFVVMDTNLHNLVNFEIIKQDFVLRTEFIINQQEADNYGGVEYIDGILAGLHYFAKKSGIYFKDLNQKDECILGDKKVKLYTRDAFSDEDMLITDRYFTAHPEIDVYVLCKIKGGKYSYLGYVKKEVVAETRVVQMTGNTEMDVSGDNIRRIFAEQYLNLSDIIKIYEQIKKEEIKVEAQKYVPLHMHSEFSVGDGFGKLSYITDKLKAKGFKGAALTDHGTLAGVWEFQKHCLAKELKPIIGIEAYIKLVNEEKAQRYHTTIFVKNEEGWKNLLKLHAIAVRDNFYYKPVIILDHLLVNHEGLIITTGCMSGPIPKLISDGKNQEAESLFDKLIEVFKDDIYCEIMSHEIENNQLVMQILHSMAVKRNVKCIFTTDTHYPDKSDKKFHDAVKAIDMKKKYGEAGYGDDCFFLMQTPDIDEKLSHVKTNWMQPFVEDFLKNTNEVFDKCNFLIKPKEEDTLPKFSLEETKKYFPELIIEYIAWKEELKIKPELLILSNHAKVEDE